MVIATPRRVSFPPRVSVITPAFNSASYVARAIRSALAQTRPDLEVIVLDDGSTDQTLAIARQYAQQDARVRVISQPNRGLASARNRAIAEARGEFIALLDSDDEWMPDYLDAQMSLLEEHPDASIVTANALNRGGAFDGRPYWSTSGRPHRLTLLDLIEREDSVCIMSVFRREVHAAIGGFDETFVAGSEDYDFWLRAAIAGFTIVRSNRPIAYYERRPESMSARPLAMLAGISKTLRKIHASLDGPSHTAARIAIDRKLAAFEQKRLGIEAAMALRSRDFATAADRFEALYSQHGGARIGLVAAWSRIAPASLLWVDALRRSVRPSSPAPHGRVDA